LLRDKLESHFKPSVETSPEGREAENFAISFIEQVFDPPGERAMWVDLVLRHQSNDRVVFDVYVRLSEIDFLASVDATDFYARE
jgi:hypothetical protein